VGRKALEWSMTRKVFWEDPYLTGIETTLTGVSGNAVTVDQTIYFAESGGQESDHGFINNHSVIQVRKEGREIVYTLENNHGLQVGQRVKMTINWERRYSLMRLHFAAEVILELVYQNLKGIEKIGAISPRTRRESTSSGMRIFPGYFPPWRKKRSKSLRRTWRSIVLSVMMRQRNAPGKWMDLHKFPVNVHNPQLVDFTENDLGELFFTDSAL
jgi:hypothetical protein